MLEIVVEVMVVKVMKLIVMVEAVVRDRCDNFVFQGMGYQHVHNRNSQNILLPSKK